MPSTPLQSFAAAMSPNPEDPSDSSTSDFSDPMYFPGGPMSSFSSLLPCFDPTSRPVSMAFSTNGEIYPASFATIFPGPDPTPPRAASERHLTSSRWLRNTPLIIDDDDSDGDSLSDAMNAKVPFDRDGERAFRYGFLEEPPATPKTSKTRWTPFRRSLSTRDSGASKGASDASEPPPTPAGVATSMRRLRTPSLFSKKSTAKHSAPAETPPPVPLLPIAAAMMAEKARAAAASGSPPPTPAPSTASRARALSTASSKSAFLWRTTNTVKIGGSAIKDIKGIENSFYADPAPPTPTKKIGVAQRLKSKFRASLSKRTGKASQGAENANENGDAEYEGDDDGEEFGMDEITLEAASLARAMARN